ncbi:efflux transporter outer membrane subunit [Pseudomonas fluorescens]|uniref:efflux transporter outer membrane subunit n=1 Tax=Pseudomonas fluorescens TaxID=294 RepID=UPI003748937C
MRRLAFLGATLWLAGCAHDANVQMPEVPLAPAYRGDQSSLNGVSSSETIREDAWWTLFQDPELDRLQRRLLDNSADFAGALARYEQAVAATDAVRAAQSITADAQLNVQRNRQSANRPLRGSDSPNTYNSGTLGLNLQYEVDLWGRIRQQVEAGMATQQAAQADLAAARVALQARLADTLVALRGADREVALLRDTETAYRRAVEMIDQRHQTGISSGLDLARAQAQLQTTRAQIPQVLAQRALYEHAIAALVGASASSFRIAPEEIAEVIPAVPLGLPSSLLQRRADIAAAQRRVVAANASVGVARTAFYPSVTLSAVGGYQSSELNRFINAPNLFWSVGPGMLLNLFDGGRRRSEVARAQAVLEEAGQHYRGVVLGSFQEVEDQLALINHYAEAAAADRLAVDASGRALDMATSRYRDGAVSYLEVVTAQTTALQAQRSALELTTRQRRATVQLVRALGGGWSAQQLDVASVAASEAP